MALCHRFAGISAIDIEYRCEELARLAAGYHSGIKRKLRAVACPAPREVGVCGTVVRPAASMARGVFDVKGIQSAIVRGFVASVMIVVVRTPLDARESRDLSRLG
jgi:hypothetical protein